LNPITETRSPALASLVLASFHFLQPAPLVRAATTIDPVNKYAYGANIGWIDWRGDTGHGAVTGASFCSGHIYSANVGWISLGSGNPANGSDYQNLSATDFGVNQDGLGNLRGYAYGANIGWINFEANGAPSVDLTSGRLSGYIYSANCGWISLSNAFAFVQTATFGPATVTKLAAGFRHSLFLKSDGGLWGMGANSFGQLGDGTSMGQDTPERIVSSGVTAIAVGNFHSLFLKSDGSLWGMGDNEAGQLGDGTQTDSSIPERIISNFISAFRITSAVRFGNDLQISFTSQAGHTYNVLNAPNLAAGSWGSLRTGVPGNGGVVQITLPNVFVSPRQFLRIQQAP
jgi:Regulator of chromosome condensation (RCC1) repeat